MIVFGVVLVVLGSGSLSLLLASAAGGTGSGEVLWQIGGLHLTSSVAPVILISGLLGLAAGASAVGGVVLILRGRVRARRSGPGEHELLETSVAARARLLEYRLEVLGQEIEALEARRSELGRGIGPEPIGLVPAATEVSLLRGRPVHGWLAVPIPGAEEGAPAVSEPVALDADPAEAAGLARRRGFVVVDDPKADEDESEGVVLVPETGDDEGSAGPPRRRRSRAGTRSAS